MVQRRRHGGVFGSDTGVVACEGSRLGNFVLIRSDTQIGAGCTIGSYVDIEGDVIIGNNVSLQSACYLTRGVIIEGFNSPPDLSIPALPEPTVEPTEKQYCEQTFAR